MRDLFALLVGVLLAAPLLAADPPELPPLRPPSASGFQPAAQQFKELIPSLIASLKDSDADVRQHSAMALAALGHDAIGPLTEAIRDPSKEKRAAAAYALGQMGYEARDAMPTLLKALKDEETAVRRSASQAVSRILNSEGVLFANSMASSASPVRTRTTPAPESPRTLPVDPEKPK